MSGKQFWRGGYTCGCVVQAIPVVETRLKQAGIIHHSVDFYQLGYRTDVAASAGTHAGGGVVDVAQFSPAAVKIWRECGWALWHRTPAQGFMHHGHGVLIGCPHASLGAKAQVVDYKAGRNGLMYHGRDDGPRVKITTWQAAKKKLAAEQAAELKRKKEAMPAPKDLWSWDGIAAPDNASSRKTNPFWAPSSYLREIFKRVDEAVRLLRQIKSQLDKEESK